MKKGLLIAGVFILSLSFVISVFSSDDGYTPPISLFSSIEQVKAFLEKKAKLDYSDKYLSGVKLAQVESVPRKGTAWVYSFTFKKPRLGGDVVIYHYMDGEMIEFTCGP
ncbi:MAG TPA: hypothetical protein PK747_02640 [Acidobacteriota bacterium]|jgi:hypothetical protein|nr:hypothetical protein [Acidobacteriota bacterium]HNT16654.1 hypothetical protein [Acidobacteriota bacterium]HPA26283.1 hypothetical protein [Acidobacteriota bacterium]HQO19533.1 hypothetical protein [Acidobacteriota bacterium]HQQ46291.1 hypothetical protein [Acidobacteriota bacterium]